MVSTLVLDVDALTLLRERLDDVPLPAGLTPGWDETADPALVDLARAEAATRLRSAGLLVPDALSGNASDDQVHPSMRAALEAFAHAGLRVDVRSWAGDRAVVADLAVGTDAGVGLTRMQRVTRPDADHVSTQDALGVELSIFSPPEVLAAIERLLPPLPSRPGDGPVAPVRMVWPDGLAVLALLRRHDSIASDQLPVAREVLRILLASAGLSAVPALFDRLAGPLEAAIRITISTRVPGAAGSPAAGDVVWFGYWLQCGGQLIGLRADLAKDHLANDDLNQDVKTTDADPARDVVLDLVPTDGPGLSTDLLTALADALPTLTAGGRR